MQYRNQEQSFKDQIQVYNQEQELKTHFSKDQIQVYNQEQNHGFDKKLKSLE